MRVSTAAGAVAVTLGVVAASAVGAPYAVAARTSGDDSARVVTKGLDDPYGLAKTGRHGFVVAENASGQVTYVGKAGGQKVLVSGAAAVAGVAVRGGRVFSVTGGGDENGNPPPGRYGASKVLRTNPATGHTQVIADLLRYELRHNPDGQQQFVHGKPVDALSNPFSMASTPVGLLVADGGANDVLRVNPRSGRISTFFVPPTVKDVKACLAPGAQANPGTTGCDPVPTGVAFARGSIWVSTLGAEVPGAGRVYQLNPRNGHVRRVWKGFTSPTGIAVARNGAVYLSEVTYGAPQGNPGPGFDPSTVGRITRIYRGHVTHAQVTMPIGMVIRRGQLYSTSWGIGSFLGLSGAGQIVRVPATAFH